MIPIIDGGNITWILVVSIIAVFCSSTLGTWVTRLLVRKHRLLDVPNQRSSHKIPTPTLGGVGIIIGFWVGMGVWYGFLPVIYREILPINELLLANAILLFTVVDDWGHPLSVFEKIILEILAAGICIYLDFYFQWLTIPFIGQIQLGYWGIPLTVFWFLFLCNMFNFMDGIDGITGGMTFVIVGTIGWVAWQIDAVPTVVVATCLGAAVSGFLVFNIPPASIFMGDIGSLFIGFFIGALGIMCEKAGIPIWVLGALLGYYLVDVIYTMLRRVINGENILTAHRKHLYQRLNSIGWSHSLIDVTACFITLLLGWGGVASLYEVPIAAWILFMVGIGLLLGGIVYLEKKHPFS
jgi:UDP-GlcNAc:undecaprenyl-phosphate/decaprenyl-phosphate GlcNAc-1-phosphate transferase